MAENKSSFLLYADYQNIFTQLSNEEAGILIKHLFAYVNDENPELEDRLLKIVFEPIKLQLKRDLKSWEKTKAKSSEAGQLGNLKRYNPKLYKMVISGKISLEDAVIQAKKEKTSGSDEPDENNRTPIKNVGSVAVTDNVTVTVTDTVTDINRAKALVAANAATEKPTRKDYEKIISENTGKELKQVVSVLKDFLALRPEFLEPYRDYWNMAVQGTSLPQVKVIGESRNKKLKVRLKEPDFDFIEIIRCVHGSHRLKKESSWFSFDWIFENDSNYAKILNGNYSN